MTENRNLALVESNPLKRPDVRLYFNMWAGGALPREQWPAFHAIADSGGLTSAFFEVEKRMKDAEPYERDQVISDVVLPILQSQDR